MQATAAARRNIIPQVIAVFAALSMTFAFPSWAYTPTDSAESPMVLSLFAILVVGLILRAYRLREAEQPA
jgi:hypothetical protein